ncbi:hypothetical protein EDB92DRAFT_2108130 [Lactarius akahatsu]|uniref:Uncharacterized protein n=1 Tax=Lactarius akahatsu TaxID=416441 RepID=A0AAD4Q7E9_9AGAM|nr:hypothetical protein EDB92DRAFT_2108130 [Lactarius akahatsu]
MNLPESVLLYIFPNGLDLSRQATSLGDGGEKSEEEEMNLLLSKQAIIVLREELEYFFMPPGGKASTDVNGIANESMLDLKRDYGKYLLKKRGASLLHCTATQSTSGEKQITIDYNQIATAQTPALLEEARGALFISVVHVRDWDARQDELVERRLACCGCAVNVADERDLDGIICDSWTDSDGREWTRVGVGRTDGRPSMAVLRIVTRKSCESVGLW